MVGEVPQAGHDLGSAAGADSRAVFAIGDVADPVQLVLDTPVAADVQRDALRPGLAGDQAGDAERGYRRTRAAVAVTDVPFDQECLAGVREDAGRGGQDLDGAGLLAPRPPVAHRVLVRDGTPRQRVHSIEYVRLGVLDCGG